MDESNNIGIRIVMLFDIIVSIVVGIKCIPSGVHVILRILIIFAIFFAAFFIMVIPLTHHIFASKHGRYGKSVCHIAHPLRKGRGLRGLVAPCQER